MSQQESPRADRSDILNTSIHPWLSLASADRPLGLGIADAYVRLPSVTHSLLPVACITW